MKTSDAFPTRFMSKDDVANPIVLHVASVAMENVGSERDQEDKPVIQWEEHGFKGTIVNNTNWQTIAAAYGDESDDWGGKPIELYYDKSVMFSGKRVGGIRVRIPVDSPVDPDAY